jgi:hypothetical protein
VGTLGEQDMGFLLGKKGYIIIDGPSGGAPGAGTTVRGIDAVAYNPTTGELLLLDNKAWKKTNINAAEAVDPAVNLRTNLDELLHDLRNSPDLRQIPDREQLINRLQQTRDLVDDWVKHGEPKGGLKGKLPLRIGVTAEYGQSVRIGPNSALARSGAVEFINLDTDPIINRSGGEAAAGGAPTSKPRPEPGGTAVPSSRATESLNGKLERRLVPKLGIEGARIEAERLAKGRLTEILGRRLEQMLESKTFARGASLLPAVGWKFSAEDAWEGVKDIRHGNIARGIAAIGWAGLDVAADFLHIGDVATGVGGSATSLAIQGVSVAAQLQIIQARAEDRLAEFMEEISLGEEEISAERLQDYYDLDPDTIRELRAAIKADEATDREQKDLGSMPIIRKRFFRR